jgi:hypothetical protein
MAAHVAATVAGRPPPGAPGGAGPLTRAFYSLLPFRFVA